MECLLSTLSIYITIHLSDHALVFIETKVSITETSLPQTLYDGVRPVMDLNRWNLERSMVCGENPIQNLRKTKNPNQVRISKKLYIF